MDNSISRRGFLGLSAAAAATFGCVNGTPEKETPPEKVGAGQAPAFELDEVSVAELRAGLASGKYTAAGITGLYLERIEQVDHSGPG